MLPDITDAVLTRAIATPRMVSAGLDYWRRGSVTEVMVDPEDGIIRASVKGSELKPYQIEVRFDARGAVTTRCSCPVGAGCKHAAAALFAVRLSEASGTDTHKPYMRRVNRNSAHGDIFARSYSVLDSGYELVCMTRLVAEPGPPYIRSAA